MNKYNVKAIRDELDKYVSNRSYNAFRKKFRTLLPPNFLEDDCASFEDAGDRNLDTSTVTANEKKLELCRAVVELKKQRSRMTGFSETCPSLLHDLCHKFQPKSSSWRQHNRPSPIPCDILEMVTFVASRKTFLAQYGKRKQTPLALLLEHNPPAYVVERLLAIMTRREVGDTREEDRLQVLYVQDSSCDTPLSQTIKRLPDADEIVQLLVEHDNASLKSLLCKSRSGNTPLFYLLHRELKEMRYEGDANNDDREQGRDDLPFSGSNLYQDLPGNLLYLLFKTQRAVLMKQGLLHSEVTDFDPVVMTEYGVDDEASVEGLFRVPTSDMDDSFDGRSNDSVRALQATICCAHQLSNDKDLTKLISILLSNLLLDNSMDAVDKDGNNFLHWVCMAKETNAFLETDRGCLNSDILSILLRHFPVALQSMNNNGLLPLHIALQLTREWKLVHRLLLESPQSARIPTSTSNSSTCNHGQLPLHIALTKNISAPVYQTAEIMELWNVYPDSARMADPNTRVLPFQLAAMVSIPSSPKRKSRKCSKRKSNSNGGTGDNEVNLQQLSTIYALLRASPEALKGVAV